MKVLRFWHPSITLFKREPSGGTFTNYDSCSNSFYCKTYKTGFRVLWLQVAGLRLMWGLGFRVVNY